MSDDPGSTPSIPEGPALAAARARLDTALLGFNRHALLADRYRRAVEQFRISQQEFTDWAAERSALREARASAAHHRMVVRAAVGQLVRAMREEGIAPEIVLAAVKTRFILSVSSTAPGAPPSEASLLAADASLWAIKAYYDAA